MKNGYSSRVCRNVCVSLHQRVVLTYRYFSQCVAAKTKQKTTYFLNQVLCQLICLRTLCNISSALQTNFQWITFG